MGHEARLWVHSVHETIISTCLHRVYSLREGDYKHRNKYIITNYGKSHEGEKQGAMRDINRSLENFSETVTLKVNPEG